MVITDTKIPCCFFGFLYLLKKKTIICMCVDEGFTALNETEKKDYHIYSEWRKIKALLGLRARIQNQ